MEVIKLSAFKNQVLGIFFLGIVTNQPVFNNEGGKTLEQVP